MSAQSVQVFSLRTKLLLFAAALVLVPGGILGAISLSSSRAAIQEIVGRQLAAEARGAADRFGERLRAEREQLASFASQDVMREIRIGDFDKRISSFLLSAKAGCPACEELLALGPDGEVVASTRPESIGARLKTVVGGRPSIDGPLRLPTSDRPALRLTAPVPDPDVPGAVLGALVGWLDWKRGTEAVSRVRENLRSVGFHVDLLVVARDGRILGGAGSGTSPWSIGGTMDPSTLVASPEAGGRIDESAGMLFGSARLPDDLPEWSIVAAQPVVEAFAPVRQTAALLASAIGVTLLLALGVAIAAARRVTRPLAALTAAAEEVGRGGPAPAIVPDSRDEIGTLTVAFNRMAVDLRKAERELTEAAKFAFAGELAAGVAHEIRTPLSVLRSSTQLIEPSLAGADDEARELLSMVRNEVDRIDRVVSGLLELGRPHELAVAPARLGEVVFPAVDFVAAKARDRGVEVQRGREQPDPQVLCDPELVYQAALNLLVNAIEIVSPGATVEVGLADAVEGFAAFEVRDDGPGISDEVRERMFEPFFTRREGGSGLGLTFVQRVVHEHRGRIDVESRAGAGTTFRIELPRAKESS